MTWSLTDPIVLKAGAGAALYAFGGSRGARLAGLALAGWAAWDYFAAPKPPAPRSILMPYDPDAPMPLTQAATSSSSSSSEEGGKVLPFRKPTVDERMMFYGIEDSDG